MDLQGKPDFCDHAVSETIGAVMLISVVVLAIAIIGVALTSQGTPQQIPALDAVISNYGNQIQIFHNGGDSIQRNEIQILVDGNPQSFRKGNTDPAWTLWSPGESLVADASSPPKLVRIVFVGPSGSKTTLASADFSPTGMNNPGPTSSLQAAFSGSPSSGPPPLVVQFTDQSSGSPAGWNWAFGDGGTSGKQNPTHVFTSPGTYTVSLTITNATGSMSSVTHPVTVSTSAPSVISISPSFGPQGTSSVPVNVYGTGFVNGATISLKKSGNPDIAVSAVVYQSATTLTGTLTIPAGAATGAWSVVVTNPDSQAATLLNGFTVTAPAGAPTVSTPTPSSGSTGSTVFITSLPGTNFQTGAQIKLNSSSAPDIFAGNITVVSPTLITCSFALSGPAGARNVVVTNPDGKVGMLPGGFTISGIPPAPVTANFSGSPTSGSLPLTVQFVDLSTGSPTTWSWDFGDSGTSTSQNPSHIYTTAGTYPVSLTVGNGTGTNSKTRAGMITASPLPPVVTSVSPGDGNHGWSITPFTVTGTGFKPDATVQVNNSGGTIIPTSCSVIVPSSITCTLNLVTASPGTYNVVVTNTADAKSGMSSGAFTVNNPALSITTLYPATARRSTTFDLAISGTGFMTASAGTTPRVVLTRAGTTTTATAVTVVDPNWVTCHIVLSGTTGTFVLTYTNGDGAVTTSSFVVT